MDTLMTFLIVGIIGLSVLPFFLLSGPLGAKPRQDEAGDGPIVPVPTGGDGSPFHPAPHDSSDDGGEDGDSGDDDGGGDDGGDGDDGGAHHLH